MSELSIAESIKQDYEEEINKQAKVIQWYEKENRHNQEIILKDTKEIERLKKREQECIDHYLVQCKYASEMESKYITANNIIKEAREYIEQYLIQNDITIQDYQYRCKELLKMLDKENKK